MEFLLQREHLFPLLFPQIAALQQYNRISQRENCSPGKEASGCLPCSVPPFSDATFARVRACVTVSHFFSATEAEFPILLIFVDLSLGKVQEQRNLVFQIGGILTELKKNHPNPAMYVLVGLAMRS